MCMGVATANSILMISFARERMDDGLDPVRAAVEAGYTRMRPVIMTALAMIIGMLPMAFGFGEGGEQNAPLGRAVIGGLLFATVATLLFVPGRIQHFPRPQTAQSRRATGCSSLSNFGILPMEQTVMERPQYTSSEDKSPRGRGGYLLAIVIGIVLAIAAVAGIVVRLSERRALAKETEELAVPSVIVVHPKTEGAQPGHGAALDLAGIYGVAHLRPHQRLSRQLVQRTLAARCGKANCWPTSRPRKLIRN